MLALKPLKPKLSPSAVQGKILVSNEIGEKISAWGGTECFLSRQTGLGPCLVVRASRHKPQEGTFFRLTGVKQVISHFVHEGKLTVVVQHQRHVCTVMISADTADIVHLQRMANIIPNQLRWGDMEVDVARPVQRGGKRGNEATEVRPTTKRTPTSSVLQQEEGAPEEDEGGDEDDDEEEDPNARIAKQLLATSSHALPVPPLEHAADSSLSLPPQLHPPSIGTSPMNEHEKALSWVRQGCNVLVTGAAGTGKSCWLRGLMDEVTKKTNSASSQAIAVTATTATAARAIRGQTVHAFAGIGKATGSSDDAPLDAIIRRVQSRPEVTRSLQACKLWIIDEIGMMTKELFTLLDHLARAIRKRPADAFGGIQLVLVGDFLQLPPVVSGGAQNLTFCFESLSWTAAGIRCLEFERDYRHEGDDAFRKVCRDLRLGYVSVAAEDLLRSCIPPSKQTTDLQRGGGGGPCTKIMPLRSQVDAYNAAQLQNIDDVLFYHYESEDQSSSSSIQLDEEVTLLKSLTLKVGCVVVVVAAVPNTPLVNGDLGVVCRFLEQAHGPHLPVIRLHDGSEHVVSPQRTDVYGRGGVSIASRTQVPLQLAWAMTVHRVQGMTLPAASVVLDRSVFAEGQAYVAISRVRSHHDLTVEALDIRCFRAHPRVIEFLDRTFPKAKHEIMAEAERRARDEFLRQARSENAKKKDKKNQSSNKERKRGRSPDASVPTQQDEADAPTYEREFEAKAKTLQSPIKRTAFSIPRDHHRGRSNEDPGSSVLLNLTGEANASTVEFLPSQHPTPKTSTPMIMMMDEE